MTRHRLTKADIAILALACGWTLVQGILNVTEDKISAPPISAVLFLAVSLPLAWRTSAPLLALGATLGALLAHAALFPDDLVRCGAVFPIVLLLAFAAGRRLGRDRALLGLGLALAIDLAVCLTDGPTGAPLGALVFFAPATVAVWGTGRVVRSRARMADELAVRTEALRHARDERARLEVSHDRARLSAELDALLHRRMGELAQLAEAGPRNGDAAATLARIESESRETLEEMRAVVGVLRSDADPVTPALTHLEALLVRAKTNGARLHVEGNPRALPAGVELSAYRVVEHLLDALEDAPGVEVGVRFGDDALEVAVAGPMRRHGEVAIERARERVLLQRGTLEASMHRGRAEAIASIPIYAVV
jgi:signal transduction histidine kinase